MAVILYTWSYLQWNAYFKSQVNGKPLIILSCLQHILWWSSTNFLCHHACQYTVEVLSPGYSVI